MVIVMEQSATEEQVQKIIETLVEVGYDVHRSTGVTHTVLGAVGVPRQPLETSQLELIPGVREVVRISEPYKLVGRTFKSADTVVDIAGVKVGSILSETLDPKTFLATVRLSVDPAYKLPDDTVAEIVSAGLLGDKYLSLVPGGSDTLIPPGGRIKYTQSSVTLENLIGQMIFSNPGAKKGAEGETPPADQQEERFEVRRDRDLHVRLDVLLGKLDFVQQRVQWRVPGLRPRHAEQGVQLVDVAVGDHARVILGHALSTDETGLALVAGPCVDPGHRR